MIAFRCSKNLQKIIESHTVQEGKVLEKSLERLNGRIMPCSSTRPSLCCTQIVNAQIFIGRQTKRTFKIFHKLTCKSQYVIYLIGCILCKIQDVGKSKTLYNLRLSNHRKDVNNLMAIPAFHHFKILPTTS